MVDAAENTSDAAEAPPAPPPDGSAREKQKKRPAGLFTRRGPEEFGEPQPVPGWIVALGECVLFGVPVLLVILPFGPRLPDFGLAPPYPEVIDLAALLAVVLGAGAAVRALALSGPGEGLRRFGRRARAWRLAGSSRGTKTYFALLGLWMVAFQLPRLAGVPELDLAGSLVFCLALALVLFTCGLMSVTREKRPPADAEAPPSGERDA